MKRYTVIFSKAAINDIQEAVNYYEKQVINTVIINV